MIIKIPFKTPTVNQMYATFGGHRVKSKEAREKAKEVEQIILPMKLEPIPGKLSAHIFVYSNWHNKDGSIKKRDIANLEKFITDSVFACLPMDDSQIFHTEMDKIQSEEEYTIISIISLQ